MARTAEAYPVQARAQATLTRTLPRALTIDDAWAIAVVLTAVGVSLMFRLSSIDLAYHVRAGETILSTGHLPAVDTFTFTVAGQPWMDQQWGAQMLIALVYRAGGWDGLSVVHAALVGATFWFLYLACRARGAAARTSSALTFAGFLVCFLYMAMRPQTLAYPLFTATLWILAGRHEHPGRLWLLPPIVAIWANLHGSFALAPVLIGISWLEDRRDRTPTKTATLVVGAVSLLATLVGPYGLNVWRYAIGITTNARILKQTQEWQVTSIRSLGGALFFLSVVGVVVYLARRGAKTDALTLAWLGTFFLVGLPAVRGVVWWGFVFPVVLAGLVTGRPESSDPAKRRGSPVLNTLIILALVGFIAVELPWWRDRIDPSSGTSALLDVAPQGLVEATRQSVPPAARVFVSQALASWFEYALPANPVFVDSRIELYPDRVWDDYLDVMNGREGWQAVLDGWHVDAVVLMSEDTMLEVRMKDDPGWRLAFGDDSGYVFVRS